jgi:hypothetical protein
MVWGPCQCVHVCVPSHSFWISWVEVQGRPTRI